MTEALNTPVQGSAAEVLLAALGRLPHWLRGLDARLVLHCHDELLLDCAEQDAPAAATALTGCMTEAWQRLFPEAVMPGFARHTSAATGRRRKAGNVKAIVQYKHGQDGYDCFMHELATLLAAAVANTPEADRDALRSCARHVLVAGSYARERLGAVVAAAIVEALQRAPPAPSAREQRGSVQPGGAGRISPGGGGPTMERQPSGRRAKAVRILFADFGKHQMAGVKGRSGGRVRHPGGARPGSGRPRKVAAPAATVAASTRVPRPTCSPSRSAARRRTRYASPRARC